MATQTDHRDNPQLIAIDLLRLASAAAVVAFHYGANFWLDPDPYIASLLGAPHGVPKSAPLTWWGWVGVEIFFVISGFVIAWSASGSGAADFARRRFLRLAPGAWVCASVTAAAVVLVGAAAPVVPFLDWVRAVSFSPTGRYIDPSYWTLGIEVSFYFGVYLLLLRGQGARLEEVARGVGAASLIFWCAWSVRGTSIEVLSNRGLQLLLLNHGCFFALGVQIWAIQRHGATIARTLWMGMFYAGGLIEVAARSAERKAGLHLPYGPVAPLAIFSVGVFIILVSQRVQPRLERLIAPSVGRGLGVLTYPLYLIHQILGAVALSVLLRSASPTVAMTELLLLLLLLTLWLVRVEERVRSGLRALMKWRPKHTGTFGVPTLDEPR